MLLICRSKVFGRVLLSFSGSLFLEDESFIMEERLEVGQAWECKKFQSRLILSKSWVSWSFLGSQLWGINETLSVEIPGSSL